MPRPADRRARHRHVRSFIVRWMQDFYATKVFNAYYVQYNLRNTMNDFVEFKVWHP